MTTKPERCNYRGCPERVTHVVKTVGGFHRRCATCAEEIALAIPERVVSVTALPNVATTTTPTPRKVAGNVAEQAAVLLPGNAFAAQITGMLVAAAKAATV